jgi:hypothetical protein
MFASGNGIQRWVVFVVLAMLFLRSGGVGGMVNTQKHGSVAFSWKLQHAVAKANPTKEFSACTVLMSDCEIEAWAGDCLGHRKKNRWNQEQLGFWPSRQIINEDPAFVSIVHPLNEPPRTFCVIDMVPQKQDVFTWAENKIVRRKIGIAPSK